MSDQLTSFEKDALGEMMNISLGAAATSLSVMFSTKVDITVPEVKECVIEDINYPGECPAAYSKITYTKGLSGANIMILKQTDISNILFHLTGMEGMGMEMDEFSLSATSELMNQMMGASATALASLFDMPVDISTPETNVFTSYQDLLNKTGEDVLITCHFNISVAGIMTSEFINVIDVNFAKEMISLFKKAN